MKIIKRMIWALKNATLAPAKDGMRRLPDSFKSLPGVWISRKSGWNMIALPVAPNLIGGGVAPFRILMNQYSEILRFTKVDADVPNRGIKPGDNGAIIDATQRVATLDYEQEIAQIVAEDFPKTVPARLPIMQGTSFAFVGVLAGIAASQDINILCYKYR